MSVKVGRVSAEALAMISNAQLDVLVYPELGMDAVMLMYAMHRLARVQCVFWGHPISQGLPSIDYFVTSDLFEGDMWRQDGYHEQSIRMEGLTAFFNKPPQPASDSAVLAELGLPSDTHIYLIPQVNPLTALVSY